MIFLVLLIGNFYISKPLFANHSFNTEIQSILMLMRFHDKQNNNKNIKYKTTKIDDCKCSINTIGKKTIRTYEVDICKRLIKNTKFIP